MAGTLKLSGTFVEMGFMRQNRRLPRKECLARVSVNWQTEGRGNKEFGMIEDKSEGGLGITFPTPINVGAVVAITQGFSTTFAVVRHCSRQKTKFFLGVEFCEVAEGAQTPRTYTAPIEAGQQERRNDFIPVPMPVPTIEKREPSKLGDFAMLEPLQRGR